MSYHHQYLLVDLADVLYSAGQKLVTQPKACAAFKRMHVQSWFVRRLVSTRQKRPSDSGAVRINCIASCADWCCAATAKNSSEKLVMELKRPNWWGFFQGACKICRSICRVNFTFPPPPPSSFQNTRLRRVVAVGLGRRRGSGGAGTIRLFLPVLYELLKRALGARAAD